jgi:cardiolipin synthase A/B
LFLGIGRAGGLPITGKMNTLQTMSSAQVISWKWLHNGDEAFPAMLAAIDGALSSVRLETYIFADDQLGRRFRDALVRVAQRRVTVRVLVDAIGSLGLKEDFWSPLRAVGGEARVFNPLALKRASIRNHRKLLVCDGRVAFIGGFNISQDYEGDGIARGWRDLGLRIEGPLATELTSSFDAMFGLAEFRHKRLVRLARAQLKQTIAFADDQLLLGGPGRGLNPIRRALHHDLARARDVQIIEAYFLPTWRIRRSLARVVQRGGSARLILAGKSDVALSQLAGRSVYRRLLKPGVEIHEYEPQVLHAKLLILDEAVYVGSANLDPRSLSINYELMVRFANPQMAGEARELFADALKHSRRIDLETWKRSRSFWTRLKERWAYFVLARVDPHVARWQWQSLPD